MAKITVVTLIDDFDGAAAPDAETVHFSLEGKAYEIDLRPENVEKLRSALQGYIEKARPVVVASRKNGTVTRVASDAGTIRAWAKSHGIDVPARGRIPASLRDQFHASTNI